MALTTFVGSFTVPATTGNKSVSGVGFQPQLVIFFGTRRSADGTSNTPGTNDEMPMTILGLATSSSNRDVLHSTVDGSGAGSQFVTAAKCIHNEGSVVNYSADFISMDSDGFTVNFTTANATAYVVNYMAIGGTDLSNVTIKSFTAPTVTGNNAQTGVGFKPDAIIFIGESVSAGGYGFVSSTTARGASSSDMGNFARYQRTSKAYVEISSTSVVFEADLVSFDTDGWTLNFTTVTAGSPTLYALCLKGADFKAGNLLQKTSTGTQATTGVGFQPTGLLFSTVMNTASTTIDSVASALEIGAASDTTHRGEASATREGTPENNANLNRAASYISLNTGSGTTQALADLSSFDADGFTLNFTTADATAREILYLALGNTGPAPAEDIGYMLNYHR